jgi:hypothetical protein
MTRVRWISKPCDICNWTTVVLSGIIGALVPLLTKEKMKGHGENLAYKPG